MRAPLHRPIRWLVPVLVAASGCRAGEADYRPAAVGEEGVITVVVDAARWEGAVGEALREALAAPIGTLPAPEPAFELVPVRLASQRALDAVRARKNVLFVAALGDTTNEARYLQGVLDERARRAILSGQRAVVARPDLWRRGQLVYYVSAATPAGLADAITARGADLRKAFDAATRARVAADLYAHGRPVALEDTLMARHGYTLRLQHDYQLAADTAGFVWLRRILTDSWRSLFVYDTTAAAALSPEWVYATRDALTRRHVRGSVSGWVEIDRRRPLVTAPATFLGRDALETRGLWHLVDVRDGRTVEAGMGGPFVTYAFRDPATGRTYLVDGMVFAPGLPKREFMRQVEVIAHTFHTRAEAPVEAPR